MTRENLGTALVALNVHENRILAGGHGPLTEVEVQELGKIQEARRALLTLVPTEEG